MSDHWNENGDEQPTGTGAGDEAAGLDEALGGDSKPTISRSTLMLVGVFALGLAMIWLLGLQAKPRAASAADTQVDSAITDMLGKSTKQEQLKRLFKDTDSLVKMFYEYPGASSIPADELPVNPFAHNGPATAVISPVAPVPVGTSAEQERLRRAAESFATLKLQSIMLSKNMAAAMINNQLVTVGAKVGEFTVTEIETQRVVLSLGKNKFELKLSRTDGQ